MIDFEKVWLPQMIGYAEMVSDPKILYDSWINGDRSKTSIIDFVEMSEQILGDLKAEQFLTLIEDERIEAPIRKESLLGFLGKFIEIDHWVNHSKHRPHEQEILGSARWAEFRKRAKELVDSAKKVRS